MKTIKNFFKIVTQKGLESEHQYVPLAIIGLISFIGYYFLWRSIAASQYESLTLRIIGSTLCLLLLLKNYWPKNIRWLLSWFWYFTLLYCFPFFFSFMVFKNPTSNVWITATVTGLFFLMLLVDWITLIILIFLGILSSWILYLITSEIIVVPTLFIKTIPTYLTVVAAGGLFLYRHSQVEKEKLKTIRAISSSMEHELRTPLRSVSLHLSSIKESFSHVIQKEKHLDEGVNLENIEISLTDAESELKSAFTIIDMLLVKSNISTIDPEKFQICSITQCVNEALRRYPFDIGQEKLIIWEECDFKFLGDKLLMVHILFNLLKNSLYYIKAAGKGSIRIWCEETPRMNTLHFYDSGQGMSPKILSHIFDAFFTKTYHGSGVGLSFCKYVMQSFGGDISCKSKENEFADFILSFPKVELK
jgi:signal transduction histidine kinase